MKLSYGDTLNLAKLCAAKARETADQRMARELWKLAGEYQELVAALDSGRRPDIGPRPDFTSKSNIVQFATKRRAPRVWPSFDAPQSSA